MKRQSSVVTDRIRRPSISQVSAVVVLTAPLILLFTLFITHDRWYDHLPLGERVSFWNEALVAYGTIALAVVTWASVRETQDVLLGEDRRYRQSKMPVLKLTGLKFNLSTCKATISNVGDGPARNVRLNLRATATWQYSKDGMSIRNQIGESRFADVVTGASYIPPGADVTVEIRANSTPLQQTIVNYALNFSVAAASLNYQDVFLAEYETVYHTGPSQTLDSEVFEWAVPESLILG